MSLEEGEILEAKFRIVRLLSQGGMGSVYLGENTLIRRQVAIKVLHGAPGGEALQRFEKEAQAAGQIGSDHIVEVLDLGTTNAGDRFMVMEYLEGETLKQRIRRARLSPEEAIPFMQQVLEGLTAAHAAGIIHRDLKPENIFVLREKAGRRDFVKILDFGISKFASTAGEEGMMTRAGMVMGTPFYMSPEQARTSHDVDTRSDLYSCGVMLYQMVTGKVPFNAPTFPQLLYKIAHEPPPDPRTLVPDLDADFIAIILKAMSREPEARYQTAREFQGVLAGFRRVVSGASPAEMPAQPEAPQSSDPRVSVPATMVSAREEIDAATQLLADPTAPLPPGDTHASWNRSANLATQPSQSPRRLTMIFLASLGAFVVVGGLAVAILVNRRGTDAAVSSREAASAIAQPTPAAPSVAASASAVAITPPIEASAAPTASAIATANAPPKPRSKAGGGGSGKPKGASTVSDFGY